MDYLSLWLLWTPFPLVSALIASIKGRDTFIWFLSGLFLGPFGLLVAFFPKLDRTGIVEHRLENPEIRKMMSKSVYNGWTQGKLTQGQAAMMLGIRHRTSLSQINRSQERGTVINAPNKVS